MKKDIFIYLLLLIISTFTLKDLAKPDFFTSHDGPNQIVRLYYFDQAIKDGQIPPRWANGLLNGFGYPLFNFSYHMPWYMAEIFRAANYSIIDSVKATFLFGYVLSGISMYVFLRALYPRLASFIGAFIYLFAPYRFVNIYVRAAIGDATAFAFAPLLFLSLIRVSQPNKQVSRYIALGGLAFAALLLSHAMIFLFFTLTFALYAIYLFLLERKIEVIKYFLMITSLGIGLSAYYLFPSLLEKNLTKFAFTFSSVFKGAVAVQFQELLYSPWGYGLMSPGEGGMSIQVGLTQWFVVVLGSIWVLITIGMKKKIFTQGKREVLFFLAIFILTILSMLEIATPFWKTFGNVLTIDFSWRILSLTVFAIAIVAGGVVASIKFPKIVGICIILFALYANRNHLRINQSLNWSIPFYLSLVDTTNMFDEYLPKWIREDDVEVQKPKIIFREGAGTYKNLKVYSSAVYATLETSQSAKIRVNIIYYPGWKAFINGKEIAVNRSLGFLDLEIPKGKSNLQVKFTDTPLRQTSNIVTLISLGISGFLLIKNPSIPSLPKEKYAMIQKRKKK